MFFKKVGCPRVRGWFSDYIDGYLGKAQAQALEEHLEGCPRCREELDSLRRVVSLLRALPREAPHRSFALRPEMVTPQPRPKAAAWGWLLPASAVASALLLTFTLAGDLAGFLPQGKPLITPTPSPPSPFGALEAITGADRSAPPVEAGGWPLAQIEYALAGLTLLLAAGTILSIWRRRSRSR